MFGNQDMEPHMSNAGSFRIYTPESFGAAIKHYREQAHLTQADLAERSGLNRTYLSQLEQGEQTAQLRRLFRVLKQLGVEITLEKTDR
jgi:transcriptional regulator with XRE-family HTH domain